MLSQYFCSFSLLVIILMFTSCNSATASVTAIPDPAIDAPLAKARDIQTAVLAGGCFWGVEAVFEHVKGVVDVKSGYAGGSPDAARYEEVSSGETGHAESVRITYDAAQISYGQLLKVFFAVAHDPTQLNRQGPDSGTQYRSAVFYANEDQKRIAKAYISQLNQAKAFPAAIVTQLAPLASFNEAESYHQNYLANHPDEPYIVINDQPKVENLRKMFPALYVSR